jgi:ATP-binding protein involved in chromosome partitioning
MFQKVDVPVLGLIENMSSHTCPACGHSEPLFGEAGGENLAAHYAVPLLAQIPLSRAIREQSDQGCPIVVSEPEGQEAQIYQQAATALVTSLAQQQPASAPVISMSD